jgi:hypothetical protein
VNIIVSVHRKNRDTKDQKRWKEPFEKLKLSKIRAENEWHILLDVAEKEAAKVHKLTLDLKIETIVELEEEKQETWEEKVANLGQKKKKV